MKSGCKVLVGKGRDHMVEMGIDARMILKCILEKRVVSILNNRLNLNKIRFSVAGSCEHGNEHSGPIKRRGIS